MTNLNTNPKKILKDPDLNQKKEDSNLNSSVTQNPQLIQKETILNSSQKTTTTKNEKKIEIEIENDPNNKTKEKKNYQKPISEMDLDEIKKEKTNWFAYVMNKNPNIKTLREQVFPLARSESFGRIFGAGKEQTKENLSRDIILQLIMQHLMAIGFRETTKSIEKEAKIKYEPHYLRDSRLQNLIRTAVKNVDFIWDQTINDYHNQINETSTGISLVEHFHSLGIEEQEDDIDELNSIWDDEEVNNIIYKENKENENSEIIAASLNKLVELLTHEKKRNVLYTKTFLMTYQSFTTPRKLLAKLIQRFHIPPEKEEIYKGRKKIIRLRVCNFLRFWITDYFEDFQPKLLPELIDFIDNSIRTANMIKMANNLKEIIERNLNENDESKENTYKTPPDPKLPKNIFSPKLNLFDVDEEEIARQLTLIEFKIYSKIKPSELLNLAWSKPKLRHKSPNVLALIHQFNKVSLWIVTIIVKRDKLKNRRKILAKIINIATFLRKQENFNCVMAILSGLGSAPISRLKYSFEDLSTKYRLDLEDLENELSTENSFQNYRKKIKQSSPPCIPYFALYLTDLTAVEDGNKDEIQGLINFGKRKLIYDLISEIINFQKASYNFQSVHQIETLLLNLENIDEQEAYTRSLKLEPRGARKDEILN